jgi:hypothetical protein
MDAVAGLMLERQRYEQWMAQLESRRSITPPHVFERVRADYQKRLDEVTRQLAGRASEVQAAIAALTERVARLSSEETALRDERYEAELRSHVGEMTPTKWSAMEKESDDRLAKLTSERTNVTADIARLQQLLGMAGAAQPIAQAPETARPSRFDELEFLKSVTGPPSGRGPAYNGGVAPPRTSGGATAPPRTSAPITQPDTPGGTAEQPASSPAAQPAAGIDTPPDAPAEPAPVPSFLKDVPQEQAKTLRCGECGALNFPTEWYCERCGAELAGM